MFEGFNKKSIESDLLHEVLNKTVTGDNQDVDVLHVMEAPIETDDKKHYYQHNMLTVCNNDRKKVEDLQLSNINRLRNSLDICKPNNSLNENVFSIDKNSENCDTLQNRTVETVRNPPPFIVSASN